MNGAVGHKLEPHVVVGRYDWLWKKEDFGFRRPPFLLQYQNIYKSRKFSEWKLSIHKVQKFNFINLKKSTNLVFWRDRRRNVQWVNYFRCFRHGFLNLKWSKSRSQIWFGFVKHMKRLRNTGHQILWNRCQSITE